MITNVNTGTAPPSYFQIFRSIVPSVFTDLSDHNAWSPGSMWLRACILEWDTAKFEPWCHPSVNLTSPSLGFLICEMGQQ